LIDKDGEQEPHQNDEARAGNFIARSFRRSSLVPLEDENVISGQCNAAATADASSPSLERTKSQRRSTWGALEEEKGHVHTIDEIRAANTNNGKVQPRRLGRRNSAEICSDKPRRGGLHVQFRSSRFLDIMDKAVQVMTHDGDSDEDLEVPFPTGPRRG